MLVMKNKNYQYVGLTIYVVIFVVIILMQGLYSMDLRKTMERKLENSNRRIAELQDEKSELVKDNVTYVPENHVLNRELGAEYKVISANEKLAKDTIYKMLIQSKCAIEVSDVSDIRVKNEELISFSFKIHTKFGSVYPVYVEQLNPSYAVMNITLSPELIYSYADGEGWSLINTVR